MIEQTALVNNFNNEEDTVDPGELAVLETFRVPERNWSEIIGSYNAANKSKFPLLPLHCKIIVEYVKKGLPAREIFKSIGYSYLRHGKIMQKYREMDDRFDALRSKHSLTDDEYEELQGLLRHPLRVLIGDIERAEGIANLKDWERFNEHAEKVPEIQLSKMRAKFKDVFSEKNQEANNFNVQINLGGDFIKDI